MIDAKHWEELNKIFITIHSITNLKEMRTKLLEQMKTIIDFDSAIIDLCQLKGETFHFVDPTVINIPKEYIESYYTHFQSKDYANWIFMQDSSIVYRDSDLIGNNMRNQSDLYKEWLSPLGLYYVAGTSTVNNGVLQGSITLFRNENTNDFSDNDLQMLENINIHLGIRLKKDYPNGLSVIGSTKYHNLTEREIEVVELILGGFSNKEISKILFVSETTIKKHLYNVYKKFNIKSRTQLVHLINNSDS